VISRRAASCSQRVAIPHAAGQLIGGPQTRSRFRQGCAGTYESTIGGIYHEDTFGSHGTLTLLDDGTFTARLQDKIHEVASIGDWHTQSTTEGRGYWRAELQSGACSVLLTWDDIRQEDIAGTASFRQCVAVTGHRKLAVGSVESVAWTAETGKAEWVAPHIRSVNEHRQVNGGLTPCDGATLVWQRRSFVRVALPTGKASVAASTKL